jgi:dephospho-CoA kinase
MVFGITGKIASGKSEVLKILEKKGFYCIDADKVAHELYKLGGEGARKIAEVFGEEFLFKNGEVNRPKLRDVVFNDTEKLELLNRSIHPLVYEKISTLLKQSDAENVAIESVYFDPGCLKDLMDKIVWVNRPKENILQTLIEERNFSPELAEKAYSLIQKPSKVDFEIVNDKDLNSLNLSFI